VASVKLILASSSPRRRQLLGAAGFEFVVDPVDVDESAVDGEAPLLTVTRLATEKAVAAVAKRDGDGEVILAADTVVVCCGRLFGKPVDEADAVAMLMELGGRNHTVATAWTAIGPLYQRRAAALTGLVLSTVRMREFGRAEASAYVEGGEPLDKAGSYAVQGQGRRLVGTVVGSVDNVIGLPVQEVSQALARLGVRPLLS